MKKAAHQDLAHLSSSANVLHQPFVGTAQPMPRRDKPSTRSTADSRPRGLNDPLGELQLPLSGISPEAEYDAFEAEYERRLADFHQKTGIHAGFVPDTVLRELEAYEQNRTLAPERRVEIALELGTPGSVLYELKRLNEFEEKNARFRAHPRYTAIRWAREQEFSESLVDTPPDREQ